MTIKNVVFNSVLTLNSVLLGSLYHKLTVILVDNLTFSNDEMGQNNRIIVNFIETKNQAAISIRNSNFKFLYLEKFLTINNFISLEIYQTKFENIWIGNNLLDFSLGSNANILDCDF
jgi:hypothetical protein